MDNNTAKKIDSKEFNDLMGRVAELSYGTVSDGLAMDDRFLIELGKVVRNFEIVSWNLQQFIVAANRGHFDQMLLSKLSFRVTIDLVLKFCKKLNLYNEADLAILKRELCNAEEVRNLVLHSLWTGGKDNAQFVTRRKLSSSHNGFWIEDFLYTDLVTIAQWFEKLITASENFVIEIRKKDLPKD